MEERKYSRRVEMQITEAWREMKIKKKTMHGHKNGEKGEMKGRRNIGGGGK